MHILYGVQTTGNGHFGKSREIVRELKRRGHTVDVIFSGEQQGNFQDVEVYEPYKVFKGLTYVTENGKINYIKTAPRLDAVSFLRDIINYDASGVDLVVSDYEPVSIQIAKRNKIQNLGLSHQYAFHYDIPYPTYAIMIRTIMEYFVPADFKVPVHFHHFGFPIMPPILPPTDIRPARSGSEKKIVVYLAYVNPQKVIRMLKKCPKDYDYYFYSNTNRAQDKDNIHVRPKNRQNFLTDLSQAEGAIVHGGFMANCEAFNFGVKTLALPIEGQAEQVANAMAIEQLGFGKHMQDLNATQVWEWLETPMISPMNYPNVAHNFVDFIEGREFTMERLSALCEETWSQIPIPSIFRKIT